MPARRSLLVLLAACLLAVTLLASACGDEKTAYEPVTYRNAKWHISFTYNGAVFKEQRTTKRWSQGVVWIADDAEMQDGDPMDGIVLYFHRDPGDADPLTAEQMDYLKYSLGSTTSASYPNTDFGTKAKWVETRVGKAVALYADLLNDSGEHDLRLRFYQIYEHRDTCSLWFCAEPDEWDEYEPEFERILSSLKLGK